MSKTRKVFLVITACIMLLFATSCTDKDAFSHGSWNEYTYSSEFLGIKLRLDANWMVFSDDILSKAAGISDMSDSSIRTAFDRGVMITEMSALKSDASSISITVQDNNTADALTEEDFFSEENLSRIRADFEETGSCTIYKDTVRFLGKDTDCINLSYTLLNISSCEIIIPVFISHYTAIVTFSANDPAALAALVGTATAI